MKWRYVALAIPLLVVALLFVADTYLGRVLAARLPAMLSDALGKPVSSGEIDFELFGLQARSKELVIGQAGQPALRADDLMVELALGTLLQGGLLFQSITATSVFVDLDQWADADDNESARVDGATVDRWLPDLATMGELEIVGALNQKLSVTDVVWQRHRASQSLLSWNQAASSTKVSARMEVSSLTELLDNNRGSIRLDIVPAESADKAYVVSAHLEPSAAGVKHTLELDTRAVAGRWEFVTQASFAWPQRSALVLERFDVTGLREEVALFSGAPATDSDDWLQMALPAFTLPEHELELRIADLNIEDEGITDIVANVALRVTDADERQTLRVTDLQATLPRALMTGSFSVAHGLPWALTLDLTARAREEAATRYLDADWLWREGSAQLSTQGATPVELLENARGEIATTGTYVSEQELPVAFRAQFENQPGKLGADALTLKIGTSDLEGSIWTDDSHRSLQGRLSSSSLDLDQLLADGTTAGGSDDNIIELPDVMLIPSDMPIDLDISAESLTLLGQSLQDVRLNLRHSAPRVGLALEFATGDKGRVNLNAVAVRDGAEQDLRLKLAGQHVALSAAPDQAAPVILDAAEILLEGRGKSLAEIVPDFTGKAEFTLSANALQRPVKVQSIPQIFVEEGKITAVSLNELQLQSGDDLEAQGGLSLELGNLALTGELSASRVDLDQMLSPADTNGESAAIASLLDELFDLDVQLQASEVQVADTSLTDVTASVTGRAGRLQFSQLGFSSPYGKIRGQGDLTVADNAGVLTMSGDLNGLAGDALGWLPFADVLEKPLDGSVSLDAQGVRWAGLLQNARLGLQLAERVQNAGDSPEFDVDVELHRQVETIHARINDLHWRESDTRGTVRYQTGDPVELDLDLTSGYLDVSVFETEPIGPADTGSKNRGLLRSFTNATRNTMGFLGKTLSGNIFSGRRAGSKDEKFFNAASWSIEPFQDIVVDVSIKASSVETSSTLSRDLSLDAKIVNGRLQMDAKSPDINGGTLDLALTYDTAVSPPQGEITLTTTKMRPDKKPDLAPLSTYVHLTGSGDNEAALAGTLNGQLYLDGGSGEFDMLGLSTNLLSMDVLKVVFGKLLPKSDKKAQLKCAIGYGEIVNAEFAKPATLLVRTNRADLLVHTRADLAKETINAQFDSRSRSGSGLNLGNVFSNTVRVQGPLVAPKVEPKPTSLLWRYGAAISTGGLSLLGESMYKRISLDPDPCATLNEALQEKICKGDTAAASSTLVCP